MNSKLAYQIQRGMFLPVKLIFQTWGDLVLRLHDTLNNTLIGVTVLVWSDPRNFVTVVLLPQLIMPMIYYL